MNPKTVIILTSCSFFIAAMGFILFAVSMDTPWLVVAIVSLLAGVLLRKFVSSAAILESALDAAAKSKTDAAASFEKLSPRQ